MDKELLRESINQAELHIRNARGEMNEAGRALDKIRDVVRDIR